MSAYSHSTTFIEKYRFWLLLIAALIVLEIPIISVPFKWFETYFHEISHGLAALLTGGKIHSIQLFINGAGLCRTYGGSQLLISFMGYCGASLWGVALYQLANMHIKIARLLTLSLLCLLVVSLVLWVRDLLTVFILLTMMIILVFKLKVQSLSLIQWLLQFIGISVLLNSVKSPWYLLDGQFVGDGAALAELTFIPELFWIACWFLIGISGIYFLAKQKVAI